MDANKKNRSSLNNIKNIIAVASGKGGVGKSTIASNLAIALAQEGYKVGILDADIYGPSLPKMFGIEGESPQVKKINGNDIIIPVQKFDVKLLSLGLFVSKDDATVWRGPLASKILQQFINDTDWGDLDYMIFDLPPGTSDIHLTLVQTLAVTGAIIISTPQDVALADAIKGIMMFRNKPVNVPILGIIENMSWFCPVKHPKEKYYIFGKDGCKKLAQKLNVPLLGQIPIVQDIRERSDIGHPIAFKDSISGKVFKELAAKVVKRINERNENIEPTKVVEVTKKLL